MSLWLDWQAAQNGAPLLKVVRRRSFRGDAAGADIRGYKIEERGRWTSTGERSAVE